MTCGKISLTNLKLAGMWQFKSIIYIDLQFQGPTFELLLEFVDGCHLVRMTHLHSVCQFVFKDNIYLASFHLIVHLQYETGNNLE